MGDNLIRHAHGRHTCGTYLAQQGPSHELGSRHVLLICELIQSLVETARRLNVYDFWKPPWVA